MNEALISREMIDALKDARAIFAADVKRCGDFGGAAILYRFDKIIADIKRRENEKKWKRLSETH